MSIGICVGFVNRHIPNLLIGQSCLLYTSVIDRAVIASPPKQSNALAANGKPQSPTWDNYDTSKLTIGGERFGTEAKDYTCLLYTSSWLTENTGTLCAPTQTALWRQARPA